MEEGKGGERGCEGGREQGQVGIWMGGGKNGETKGEGERERRKERLSRRRKGGRDGSWEVEREDLKESEKELENYYLRSSSLPFSFSLDLPFPLRLHLSLNTLLPLHSTPIPGLFFFILSVLSPPLSSSRSLDLPSLSANLPRFSSPLFLPHIKTDPCFGHSARRHEKPRWLRESQALYSCDFFSLSLYFFLFFFHSFMK